MRPRAGSRVAITADGSRILVHEKGYDDKINNRMGRVRAFDLQGDTWVNFDDNAFFGDSSLRLNIYMKMSDDGTKVLLSLQDKIVNFGRVQAFEYGIYDEQP